MDKELRVRLPDTLRDRVDRFAVETHRTLTGAVTVLLTEALDARERPSNPETETHYR